MGIFQAKILEWLPCPLPGDLPKPGIEPRSPALQADSSPSELLRTGLSSVLFSSVVSGSLQPHGLQHTRLPSITNSRNLLKLMSIASVMPSNHLILCCPLLLPPSIFPSIRVFSNESVLCIRWPKIGVSASASVLPMNIQN